MGDLDGKCYTWGRNEVTVPSVPHRCRIHVKACQANRQCMSGVLQRGQLGQGDLVQYNVPTTVKGLAGSVIIGGAASQHPLQWRCQRVPDNLLASPRCFPLSVMHAGCPCRRCWEAPLGSGDQRWRGLHLWQQQGGGLPGPRGMPVLLLSRPRWDAWTSLRCCCPCRGSAGRAPSRARPRARVSCLTPWCHCARRTVYPHSSYTF